jgi:hypothetical protein
MRWGLLFLGISLTPLVEGAEKPLPEVVAVRELRSTLLEKKKADQALLASILADGIQRGLWRAEDRAQAEADLERPEPAPSRISLASKAADSSSVNEGGSAVPDPLRDILSVKAWARRNREVIDAMVEQTFTMEYTLLADFAEKSWCDARTMADLAPAAEALAEVRARDSARWELEQAKMARIVDYGDAFGVRKLTLIGPPQSGGPLLAQLDPAFYFHTIVASEDGFLPPDPAVDIHAYRRWREMWNRLVQVKHYFAQRPRVQARFAALEARYQETDWKIEQAIVDLLRRDAPASDYVPVLQPVLASPPFVPGLLRVRLTEKSDRDYRAFVRLFDHEGRPHQLPPPEDLPFGAYVAIWQLRDAEASGRRENIEQAQLRVDGKVGLVRPELAKLLAARKAARLPVKKGPETVTEPREPASAMEALLVCLESPSGKTNINEDAYFGDPLRAALQRLSDGSNAIGLQNQSGYWSQAFNWRFALGGLRDRAAREQLAKILKAEPASTGAGVALSVLWSAALEAAIARESFDEADRLLAAANCFGVFPDEQSRRWGELLPQLRSLSEKGQDKQVVRQLGLRILGSSLSEAATGLAAARLKALTAEGK